jgi:hypothetical protein
VDAHDRAHPDPERGADRGGFQPQRAEGVVHRVVVVPHPPVRALGHVPGVALAVDQDGSWGADQQSALAGVPGMPMSWKTT